MDEQELQQLVQMVIQRLHSEIKVSEGLETAGEVSAPIFDNLEKCVAAAVRAQEIYSQQGLEKRRQVIEKIRQLSRERAEMLARMTVEETKMGRWEDKVQKNLLAANKTPGVEDVQPVAYTGDRGLTLVERAPLGVIAAVTPSTNPTSTVINNSISILAAGNAVIFAPHPAAKKCSQAAIKMVHEAVISVGAPAGLVTTVEPPSIEFTNNLLRHPAVKANLVTGGPAIVKVAMAAGKKTIAAGPGNPPVVVDETAEFPRTVESIVSGASFDNGVLCTAEKEVILVEAVVEKFLSYMRQEKRAYELTSSQMDELAKIVIKEPGGKCKEGVMNRDYVGRNASVIARAIGLNLPDSIRLLWGVVPNDHPFVWTEQLMPVLPVTVVPDINAAIKFAVEVEGDNHHTFIMHSLNIENLSNMARVCRGSIFVKNGPSYMGLGMGEGYGTLSIATPTGDGLTSARTFTRPLRCVLVDYFHFI